ncbi:DUF4332 domain-containing protein [Alkalinema sp. FACHB-956]|nr:DUF4332 domain-containing protein [Alkalinema sp. FACHB-956]
MHRSKPTPNPTNPPQRKGSAPARLKSANWLLSQLPGLSEQDQAKLRSLNITTTHQLLKTAWTATAREALAAQLNLHLQHVQKWVALADLARVPSVGCQYNGLLLHAGVATVERLAQLQAGQLHRQILKLQVTIMQRPDLCPNAGEISHWIRQAQLLLVYERQP